MPVNTLRPVAGADADVDPRRIAGLRLMEIIGGPDYAKTTAVLGRLSPDFVELLIATGYGELLSRPALDIETRELVTVAVLAARGNTSSAFRFHCGGMLNTGWTPVQVLDAIRLAGACTSPAAFSGNLIQLGQVLASRGIGMPQHAAPSLQPQSAPHVDSGPAGVPAATAVTTPSLDTKMRHIAILAILIALVAKETAVRREVSACLRAGWGREQIVEVLIHLTGYVGWPMVLASAAAVLDALDGADGADGGDGAADADS